MLFWLVTPALLLALVYYFNISRARKKTDFELQPNCLLLPKPLVFIDGKKSPFYFMKYWNEIPHFMFEHGYEVFELTLPWRNLSARREALKASLDEMQKQNMPAHFIIDESAADLLSTSEFAAHPAVLSVFKIAVDQNEWLRPLDIAHRLWTGQKKWSSRKLDHDSKPHQTAKEILQHAIMLAEKSV